MKNTRRFISAVMALAMVSAIAPMSAFAIDQDDVAAERNEGTMTATYDVTAKYTVTIPAGVTLDSTNAVSKNIEASDVMLESGQKINVTLDEASHTTNGTTFHAQNTAGDSTATYTINNGTKDIAVGDVVATFANNPDKTADPDVQTSTLTFSKAEGATYAGTHTETLTFGISVTKTLNIAVYNSTETISLSYTEGQKWTEATTFIDSTQYESFYDQLVDGNDRGYKPGWYSFEEDGLVAALYLLTESTYYVLYDNDFNIVDANSVISEESSYILTHS